MAVCVPSLSAVQQEAKQCSMAPKLITKVFRLAKYRITEILLCHLSFSPLDPVASCKSKGFIFNMQARLLNKLHTVFNIQYLHLR